MTPPALTTTDTHMPCTGPLIPWHVAELFSECTVAVCGVLPRLPPRCAVPVRLAHRCSVCARPPSLCSGPSGYFSLRRPPHCLPPVPRLSAARVSVPPSPWPCTADLVPRGDLTFASLPRWALQSWHRQSSLFVLLTRILFQASDVNRADGAVGLSTRGWGVLPIFGSPPGPRGQSR